MELLHPTSKPTNSLEIKMPDGSSLEVHAPGAPDVLRSTPYEFIAEAGKQLEPLGSAEPVVSLEPTEYHDSYGSDSVEDLPDLEKAHPFADTYEDLLHGNFELTDDPSDRTVVLASGIALRGIGNAYRRFRAKSLRNSAIRLDELASSLGHEIADEVEILEHRKTDTRTKKGMYSPKPIKDATGAVVGEESIGDQYYGKSIGTFQDTHTTRRLFFDERGKPITKDEHQRREEVKDKLKRIGGLIEKTEAKHAGGPLPATAVSRISRLEGMAAALELDEPTQRANAGNTTLGRWQTLSNDELRARDFTPLTDPRKREASTRNSEIRHELSEIMMKINAIKGLYGLTDLTAGVPDNMPQTAVDELNKLENERLHLSHEMSDRRTGTDKDSRKQKSDIAKTAKARQSMKDKAQKKRDKADDHISKII